MKVGACRDGETWQEGWWESLRKKVNRRALCGPESSSPYCSELELAWRGIQTIFGRGLEAADIHVRRSSQWGAVPGGYSITASPKAPQTLGSRCQGHDFPRTSLCFALVAGSAQPLSLTGGDSCFDLLSSLLNSHFPNSFHNCVRSNYCNKSLP